MKIRYKFPLYSALILLLAIFLISFLVLSEQYYATVKQINENRTAELNLTSKDLKNKVSVIHQMLSQSYESSRSERIEQDYGLSVEDQDFVNIRMFAMNIMNVTLENIRLYGMQESNSLTINEITPPYPFVLHPTEKALEGTHKVEYYGENSRLQLYQELAKLATEQLEGEMIFQQFETGEKTSSKKMVFVKSFEPLSWMIISQKDISYIEDSYNQNMEQLNNSIWNSVVQIIAGTLALIIFNTLVIGKLAWKTSTFIQHISAQIIQIAKGYPAQNTATKAKEPELQNISNAYAQLMARQAHLKQMFECLKNDTLSPDANEQIEAKDELGQLALGINHKLNSIKEENEKQMLENKKRNWATEGLAMFNDILRHRTENIEELAHDIVKELVRYINANQGALFIYNNNDPNDVYLDAIATFAYAHKRFYQKRIELGEGLAGQCALEKQTIYITNVPQDYINITSGLGTANPKSILIVPMKIENHIFGILEIASFQPMEKYEIEFVEKLSESIAATLYSVTISSRTNKLLEESRRNEELRAEQEQKMKASMLELESLKEKLSANK